jgi:hypothetical protein
MRKILLSSLAVALGATAFLTGCEDGSTSLEAPLDGLKPSFEFIDGSSGGNPGVYFRAPLGIGWQRPGTFDPSVPLRIEIRQRGTSTVEEFSVEAGTVDVYPALQMYSLWWEVPDATPGTIFEVSVKALTLELAYADLEIAGNFRDWLRIRFAGENVGILDFRRLVPIRIYVNTDAVANAEEEEEKECESGGIIIDCDVEILDNTTGGGVEVFDGTDPGALPAAILTVEPGDVVDAQGNPVEDFILKLLHLPISTKPSPVIPTVQQFPFIVEGSITDGLGNPLFFAEGASLILCQPENIHTEVPEPQAAYQQIFKVDDGVTTFLPTTYGAPECEWGSFQPVAMTGSAGARLLQLAQRGLRNLGGLFLPEPARASHGGLRSIREIGDLSYLGASLVTVPSVSTAAVPDGTVDSPTTIDIQAMIPGELVQLYGGDDVVVRVSGANDAVLTIGNGGVLDNDDGTYRATYTPGEPGQDRIEIEILDPTTGLPVGIEGSPFTSLVDPGILYMDGVKGTEWLGSGSMQLSGGSLEGGVMYYWTEGTYFYIGLEITDSDLTASDQFEVRFDNTLDGVYTPGDDELSQSGSGFTDGHYNGSNWGVVDTYEDGRGAAGASDGVNFFEFAHPLSSGDPLDFSLQVGQEIKVCVRYFQNGTATGSFPSGCATAGNQNGYASITPNYRLN